MALSILRLSSSFPEIFGMSSAFTFENIVQMLQIHDTLNHGCYKAVTKDDFDKFEKKKDSANEYQLYCRRNGSDGTSVWEALEDAESAISSSTEIYFKKRGATGKDDSDYVQLYSLIQLDPAKFNEAKSFKHDPASYVASLLYATCCMHKKMMELYMADIEAINDEQKEMNEIMNLLKQMQEDLAALDAGVTDETKHNKATLDPDILYYFLKRGLLDTNATQGILTKDVIEELKSVFLGAGKAASILQQFKQWSVLTALLGEGRAGFINMFRNPSKQATTPKGAISNPFDPLYWRCPSEVKDDPYGSILGLRDHWLFSPYFRDKAGNFLDTNGNIVPPDADFRTRARIINGEWGSHRALYNADNTAYPAYTVRWYGGVPPKSADEYLRGLAGLLRQNQFFPDNFTTTSGATKKCFNDDGSFSDDFWRYVIGGDQALVAVCDSEYKKVKRFTPATKFNKSQLKTGEVGICLNCYPSGSLRRQYDLSLWSQECYWPVGGAADEKGLAPIRKETNAYEELIGKGLNKMVKDIELNSDQVTTWTDTLRIYCDRISNESSSQSSQMNMELQYSQQFLNTATQLLAKLNRMMTDIASHIH